MGGPCRGAVAGARRGVARRDSNSGWLGRLGRAPRAAISGRSWRGKRRSGFSSQSLRPGRSTRGTRTCSRSSRRTAASTQSRRWHRRRASSAGVARPRRGRGGEERRAQKTRSGMRRVARPPVRSPFSLRAPPSSSGGASCRAKGARPAPLPWVPHRREQRRHRAAPDVELRFGGCYRPTALTTEIPLCSAAVSQ